MDFVELDRKNVYKRVGFLISFLAFLILLSRLPTILLTSSETLFDPPDELEMTFSTADRFLGVPSVSLAWPGGTLQAIELPVLLSDFIAHSPFPTSGKDFSLYISNLYRDPWHAVMLARCVVIFMSSIGIACFYVVLFRCTSNRFISFIGILLMASLPMVWLHSHMATADGLGMALTCASISTIYWREKLTPVMAALAGALLGLAVASKITFVLLIPFASAILLFVSSRKTKDLGAFLIWALVAFLFACPYMWTDPIRLAKAILGNASRPGKPLGVCSSFLKMGTVSSLPIFLLSAAGAYLLARRKQWTPLIGILLSLIASLAITAKAAVVFDRYYLPSVLPLTFLACIGIREFKTLSEKVSIKRIKIVYVGFVIAIAGIVCVQSTIRYVALIQESSIAAQPTEELISIVQTLKRSGPVAVPPSMLYYIVKDASSHSVQALANRIPPFLSRKPSEILEHDEELQRTFFLCLGDLSTK